MLPELFANISKCIKPEDIQDYWPIDCIPSEHCIEKADLPNYCKKFSDKKPTECIKPADIANYCIPPGDLEHECISHGFVKSHDCIQSVSLDYHCRVRNFVKSDTCMNTNVLENYMSTKQDGYVKSEYCIKQSDLAQYFTEQVGFVKNDLQQYIRHQTEELKGHITWKFMHSGGNRLNMAVSMYFMLINPLHILVCNVT